MICGLYMGRSARPIRRLMCFDGPARTAAHEIWCTTATTTSTVPMRSPTCSDGPARAVAHEMWYTFDATTTFLGVPGAMSAKNSYLVLRHFWQIASGVQYNMMPGANVGSTPWYCCGCTDVTPCRLGDAGSMTSLPWFVPRTEPSAKLPEVGPDRGHLLTESCIGVHLHVCRCRTGDGDRCCCSVGSRPQSITACAGGIFAR